MVSRLIGNGELLPCTERSIEEIDRKERRKIKDVRMSEIYRKKKKEKKVRKGIQIHKVKEAVIQMQKHCFSSGGS